MTTIFIVSAPSGSGKSTLVRRLLTTVPGLLFSVSYTTRAPRGDDLPGAYHFVSHQEFEQRLAAGEFLEHANVHGNYYGTNRGALDQARAQGLDLVLDIDVQGARQLKSQFPEAVSIFILAPSREILEKRLRERSRVAGNVSEEVIQRRLRDATGEIRNYGSYDYLVVNDQLAESEVNLTAIVRGERARRCRMEEKILPILETFGAHE